MRAIRPTVIVGAVALALASCDSDSAADDTDASSSTAPPVTSGPVAAAALVPGDCVTGLVLGIDERIEIETASVVRCDQPHELEVFAVFDLRPDDFDDEDGAYPGRRRVVDAADDGCEMQRAELGDTADSIGLITVWPTAESWAAGDRAVACAAYSVSGTPIGDDVFDR